jgi:hypothetical protein
VRAAMPASAQPRASSTGCRLGMLPLMVVLALAACGGPAPVVAGPLPADVAKLLPAGAEVSAAQQAAMRGGSEQSWVILYTLPNPPGSPSGSQRFNAQLSIADRTPGGWRLAKTMGEVGPVGAKLEIATVDKLPAAAVSFGVGANSSGMWLMRADGPSYAVIYDGTGDGISLQDLNSDGTPEVVRQWSPFCQSHVASPRLTTVYAFKGDRYVASTSLFPGAVAKDAANVNAALTRAADPATKPAWQPADKACLHAALALVAGEAGNYPEQQAQTAQAKQLDPSYDVAGLAKLAAG